MVSKLDLRLEQIGVLHRQEQDEVYRKYDYFHRIQQTNDPKAINEWCRFKMVEWCYGVVDFVNFSRNTVGVAISYLDRFLSHSNQQTDDILRSRKQYQLATMTCLFTAIKIFEPKMIDTNLLTQLSRGSYSTDDFKEMELEILRALNWHLNDPIPFYFLNYYVEKLPLHECELIVDPCTLLEHAKYQIELSLVDYSITIHEASKVAFAALGNSINSIFTAHGASLDAAKMIGMLQKVANQSFNSPIICHISIGMERLHNTKMPVVNRRNSSNLSSSSLAAAKNYDEPVREDCNDRGVQTNVIFSPACVST